MKDNEESQEGGATTYINNNKTPANFVELIDVFINFYLFKGHMHQGQMYIIILFTHNSFIISVPWWH